MNDEYAWWFLVVGLAVGGALVWLVRGQMARQEDDVAEEERAPEAEWISRTVERAGGIAPADLVAQVLSLHRSYLREADPFEPDPFEPDPFGPDPFGPDPFAPADAGQDAGADRLSRGEEPARGEPQPRRS